MPFTWTNKRQGVDCVFEKLDRAYCDEHWKEIFPNAQLQILPIFLSDQNPIILDCNPTHLKRRRPYKLEAWCIQLNEIQSILVKA